MVFVVLILFFFYDPLLTGKTYFFDDIEAQYYPMRLFQHRMTDAGKLFLWNPYIFSGLPYLADIQTALFYPPNWIYFLLEPARGMVYYIVLHYILAGLFTYLFLRKLDLEPFSCLGGAIFYTFSGFMVLHTIHLNIIAAYALLPLLLLLTENLARKNDMRSALLLGLVLGIHLLAGMAQISMFAFIIVFIYFLGRLEFRDLLYPPQMKLIGYFALAVFLSIMLAAVQLVPSFEFLSLTLRGESVNFADAAAGSMTLRDMIMFMVPDYMGHPMKEGFNGDYFFWEKCFYMGVFPIILFFLGMLIFPAREKKTVYTFLILAVLGIILALGKFTPVYGLLYKIIPFFKSFRAPMRFLIFTMLGMTYFIALALDQIPELFMLAIDHHRKLATAAIAVLGVNMLILAVFLLQSKALVSKMGLIYFLITGFGGIIPLVLSLYGAIDEKLFRYAALTVLVVSVFSFGLTWNPTVPVKFYDEMTKAFAPLEDKVPPARVHYYPPLPLKDTLNLPSTRKVSNIVGYNPTALRNYLEYLIYSDYSVPVDQKLARRLTANGNIFGLQNLDAKMLQLLNLSWVIESRLSGGEIKWETHGIKREILPRAFTVPNYRVIGDSMKTLKTLKSGSFDYTREVILAEEPEGGFAGRSGDKEMENRAQITMYTPDRILLKVYPRGNCWLFLSEVYYPGWKAKVDGKKRKIYRANHTFRAIPLKEGDEKVEIYFRPDSVKLGAFLFGAALSFILVSLILPVVMKK